MRREPREVVSSAPVRCLDAEEQRFYAVMHHLATVLWMKGATVEALAALSAVLEWVSQKAENDASRPKP